MINNRAIPNQMEMPVYIQVTIIYQFQWNQVDLRKEDTTLGKITAKHR